jgi:hypothetical protein
MIILNEEQTAKIVLVLERMGAKSKQIKWELLDHASCLVEEKMKAGASFEEALSWIKRSGSQFEIEQIEQTALRIKLERSYKQTRKFTLSTLVAASLMLFTIVVYAGNKPDSHPFIEQKAEINEHYDQNVEAYLYEISENLDICATAKGKVDKIISFDDGNKTKYSIFADHGFGYASVYISLDTVYVSRGDQLKKGKLIGRINKAKGDPCNYFGYQLLKSGKPVKAKNYFR